MLSPGCGPDSVTAFPKSPSGIYKAAVESGVITVGSRTLNPLAHPSQPRGELSVKGTSKYTYNKLHTGSALFGLLKFVLLIHENQAADKTTDTSLLLSRAFIFIFF